MGGSSAPCAWPFCRPGAQRRCRCTRCGACPAAGSPGTWGRTPAPFRARVPCRCPLRSGSPGSAPARIPPTAAPPLHSPQSHGALHLSTAAEAAAVAAAICKNFHSPSLPPPPPSSPPPCAPQLPILNPKPSASPPVHFSTAHPLPGALHFSAVRALGEQQQWNTDGSNTTHAKNLPPSPPPPGFLAPGSTPQLPIISACRPSSVRLGAAHLEPP